ncbi:cupin [Rhodoblastus sphagnicola]|uniref:Cupin n=1 Tax=Rhodoblastus sphagnicola TaxID=333368 RepID=A0A2S6MXZ0_9HYPH|nr:cupin domain-containing protein [Rhodoblastus sphagnicola]MBB4198089.1 putative cupin superfamily protein [Rhodoblastus sphagnicola]PPQ27230.1 cupin [Rhodoblastus sphagnicola]
MSNSTSTPRIIAENAVSIPPRAKKSNYPEPFASRMQGREKRALGDFFGLTRFGVNLVTLAPGAESALLHRHSRQEECVYILDGHPTLVTDAGEFPLAPGMCAGFPPDGVAHQLVNRAARPAVYLEIGDRPPGDEASYPVDDLAAEQADDGRWRYRHKDGRPY